MSDVQHGPGLGGEGHPQNGSEGESGQNNPQGNPGEPQFTFGVTEVAGAKFAMMGIESMNGVGIRLVIRPALALTVARLFSDAAKLAKTGLVLPPTNGNVPEWKGPNGG